jgi:tetratricopeptide (TPR) repeat protein
LTLRLEPLPAEDARTLAVAAAGDRRLTEEELAALMERGAGNPLFLRELASVGEKTDEAEELPETVEALVATRIDQLGPGDRALLRWASVLGVSFSASLIADVLVDDPLAAAGSEAWDRLGEFVERDPDVPGAFRFRHALIRDAAYEGLSYKRRRELHGRVAEIIERRHADRREDAAELLSLHYFSAGRWPEAWTYSRLAGDSAREVYANVDAASFYERAIEASARVETLEDSDLAGTWRSLAEVRDAAGDYRAALEAFKVAVKLLSNDPQAQAEIYEARALARIRLSSYSDALREITAGLGRARTLSGPNAKQAEYSLLARRAQIFLQQGRPREAIAIANEVVRESEPLGASVALARAYSALEGGYLDIGQPENAIFEEKAMEIFRSLGATRSAAVMEMNLGVKAYAHGTFGEASERYSSARDEFERVGDVTQAAYAAANLGEVLVTSRRLEEAEAVLTDARQTLRASEYVFAALFSEIQLARLAMAKGDPTTAVSDLTRIVDEARAMGDIGFAIDAWVHLADAYHRVGNPERSLAELDHAERLLVDAKSPLRASIARVRATALTQTGDLSRAGDELSTALSIARGQGLAYEEALILVVLARLAKLNGREDEAADALHEARRLMQRVGAIGEDEQELEPA